MLADDLADRMSLRLLRQLLDEGVEAKAASAVADGVKPEWARVVEHGGFLSVWVAPDGAVEWTLGSAEEIVAELASGVVLVDVGKIARATMAEWRGPV